MFLKDYLKEIYQKASFDKNQLIVENTINCLTKQGINAIGANVAILGLTFKENCPDIRNTKIFDILIRTKKS